MRGSQLTANWNSGGHCLACRRSKQSYTKEVARNAKRSEWLALNRVAFTGYYYGSPFERAGFAEACITLRDKEL